VIEIQEAAINVIEDHARDAFPEECCGFLFGRPGEPKRIIEARRAKNIAPEDRDRRYVIDPLELLHADDEARTRDLDLVGIYHSHPNHPAVPSEFDRSRATPWYSYLILSIVDREPRERTAWRFNESTKRFEREEILRSPEKLDSRKPRKATKHSPVQR
jgi:proteasome lid subunit RPN8/RPN11